MGDRKAAADGSKVYCSETKVNIKDGRIKLMFGVGERAGIGVYHKNRDYVRREWWARPVWLRMSQRLGLKLTGDPCVEINPEQP